MIYEYLCQAKKCGVVSEVIQRLSEEPLTRCPKCKRGKVIKLISLPAHPVVQGDIRDDMMKIRQDAKKTAQKIIKGDQKTIEDIYGDGSISNKTPKPKTLDQIKNGKIKRVK